MAYPPKAVRPGRLPTRTLVSIVAAAVAASAISLSLAAEPAAAKRDATSFAQLLPVDTVAYLHLPQALELREKWWQTSLGRMLEDPQLKPLLDQSWGAVERSFEPIRERFGLSLTEWLQLPNSEFGFAVVPIDGAEPAAMLMLAAGAEDRAIELLLERGREAAQKAGMIEEHETIGDVRLTIWRTGAGRSRQVVYLRRAGRLVVTTHRDAAKRALELWTAGGESLADQASFTTLERLVGRAEGEAAQAFWFVDPINLIRQSMQGNRAAQIGIAILPALGLDGLSALGGSVAFQRGPFETISQAYLLLDTPRTGALELLALRPTPTEPEPWVFDDLTSYGTFSWDVERTYHELRKLVDSFQGDGAFRRAVGFERVQQQGLDLEKDVIAKLTGRVSIVTALEQPLTPESRGHLLGFQVKDAATAERIAKLLVDLGEREATPRSFAGRKYFEIAPRNNPFDERPRSAIGSVNDCVLVSNHSAFVQRAYGAADDESKRLAGALDYKLIAAKAKRYAGDDGPGYLSFTRPDEELRFVHALVQHQQVREQINRRGERTPLFHDLDQALTDRPPPPFEVLQRYFAPGGAVIVDEPTGIRYFSFVLKRAEAR